ncbi:MAG: DNA-directed RNA polymerase subunit beta, partial [Deinococcus sp.]|nr:DNA-directed RNA polymerase subunit beta [Deinococcus sp.]
MSLHTFGRIKETLPLPPLTEVQLKSFYDFLQLNVLPDKRRSAGLQGAFLEVFPIEEGDGRSRGGSGLVLDFLEYRIDQPKHTPAECRERDLTYQAPMFVKLQLIQRDTGLIKEDSVFLGDLPMMTPDGSFIINGAERVVVSQIHRSPGAYFTVEPRGAKEVVAASIIPMPRRGPWLELEFDNANVLWLKVNKRKFPVTLLLRVLGFNADAVRALMGPTAEALEPTLREDREYAPSEALLHLFSIMRPGEPPREEKAVAFLFNLLADPRRFDLGLPGRYKMNHKLEGVYREMKWKLPKYSSEDYAQTLLSYDPAQAAKSGLYFQDQGIVPTVRYLCGLHLGLPGYEVDDIDHLGNRRVRTVGELLGDTIRLGLGRMARGIRERMLLGAPEAATPQKIVNNRPVVAAIREFFGRSQLSQFKDQLNPLAELRHKRRISALGPGGLTRERAGFDVRDVHRTHYGRICPIETPEGANIGLISHLAAHAKVNALGFIETPYRKVVKGKVTDEIVYLTADNEDKYIIAQANTKLGKDGVTLEGVRGRVVARVRGDPVLVLPERVELMDVTPKQIVSVSTGLIPFLEHDDANRALMGANMQNQAVPLLRAEPPLVCTGIEDRVALDSGTLVLAEEAGVVSTVGPRLIKVKNGKVEKEYPLTRFTRSNQTTCIDHQPVVRPNQKVQAGDLLADGPASRQGKLALGHNILIAFMPLEGYNFE